METVKNKPNRLFRWLLGVSVMIHAFIFMHVAGIYDTRALSFIEMTLEDISKPFSRDIPRPRLKQKPVENPRDVKRLKIKKFRIPQMRIDPISNNPNDMLTEDITVPDIPEVSDIGVDDLNPLGDINYMTPGDYYEMVRLRIESRKKYPDSARLRHMEGRVTVRYVINQDGKVSGVKIIQATRHGLLNTAALEAVKKASPFPRPPCNLFKEPISMEITIVFELT